MALSLPLFRLRHLHKLQTQPLSLIPAIQVAGGRFVYLLRRCKL